MNFWILATSFVMVYKTHGYELLFHNVLILCVWNFVLLEELCLKN
jgi:hypothetical protein